MILVKSIIRTVYNVDPQAAPFLRRRHIDSKSTKMRISVCDVANFLFCYNLQKESFLYKLLFRFSFDNTCEKRWTVSSWENKS